MQTHTNLTPKEIEALTYSDRELWVISFNKSLESYFPNYIFVVENKSPDSDFIYYWEHKTLKYRFVINFWHCASGYSRISVSSNNKNYINIYETNGVIIESPVIKFSIEKSIDKIAKDINRRFLPEFELYSEKLFAALLKKENVKNKNLETALTVSKLLNTQLREWDFENSGKVYSRIDGVCCAHISENRIRLELGLMHTNKALKVIEFIKTLGDIYSSD